MADWGMGIFKLGACDYCDDIVGETADISFGDAWLRRSWPIGRERILRSLVAAGCPHPGGRRGQRRARRDSVDCRRCGGRAGGGRPAPPGRSRGPARKPRSNKGVWAPTKRVEPVARVELTSAFAQRMLNREAIATASPATFLEAGGAATSKSSAA